MKPGKNRPTHQAARVKPQTVHDLQPNRPISQGASQRPWSLVFLPATRFRCSAGWRRPAGLPPAASDGRGWRSRGAASRASLSLVFINLTIQVLGVLQPGALMMPNAQAKAAAPDQVKCHTYQGTS